MDIVPNYIIPSDNREQQLRVMSAAYQVYYIIPSDNREQQLSKGVIYDY